MPTALKMPELEVIDHAGLDSVVYLRIYSVGLKIFVPIAFLAFAIMVHVNWTNDTLENSNKKLNYSNVDKLSISNIPLGSRSLLWLIAIASKELFLLMFPFFIFSNCCNFWTHIVMAYAFTFWTCYVLKREYENVAKMRLHFLVLVQNVPPDPDESVSQLVEHFFLVNHPDHYLTHQVVYDANKLSHLVNEKKNTHNWLDFYQLRYFRNQSKRSIVKTGFLGLWGKKVDGYYIALHRKRYGYLLDHFEPKCKKKARDVHKCSAIAQKVIPFYYLLFTSLQPKYFPSLRKNEQFFSNYLVQRQKLQYIPFKMPFILDSKVIFLYYIYDHTIDNYLGLAKPAIWAKTAHLILISGEITLEPSSTLASHFLPNHFPLFIFQKLLSSNIRR
ncbi:hypothetical protein UlMin_025725 [Ulmus minor]